MITLKFKYDDDFLSHDVERHESYVDVVMTLCTVFSITGEVRLWTGTQVCGVRNIIRGDVDWKRYVDRTIGIDVRGGDVRDARTYLANLIELDCRSIICEQLEWCSSVLVDLFDIQRKQSPVLTAVMFSRYHVLELLLSEQYRAYTDIDGLVKLSLRSILFGYSTTLLMVAICNNATEIVDLLISCGASVNRPVGYYTPLDKAIAYADYNIAHKLCLAGAFHNVMLASSHSIMNKCEAKHPFQEFLRGRAAVEKLHQDQRSRFSLLPRDVWQFYIMMYLGWRPVIQLG